MAKIFNQPMKMLSKRFLVIFLIFMNSGCGYILKELSGGDSKYPPPSDNERIEYVERHSEIDPKIKECILNGRIAIDMTKEEVKASLGEPDYIKEGRADKYYDTLWIYIPHWKFRDKVYFKNSVVVKID